MEAQIRLLLCAKTRKIFSFLVVVILSALAYRAAFQGAVDVGIHRPKDKTLHSDITEYLTAEEKFWLEEKLDKAERNKKIILTWNKKWKRYSTPKPLKNALRRECGSCYVTGDRSWFYRNKTDAVVVHYLMIKPYLMPPKQYRKENQMYVWFTLESSYTMNNLSIRNHTFFDEQRFNMTMSPWRHGDIYVPYQTGPGMYIGGKTTLNKSFGNNFENVMKRKTKLILAMISDCQQTQGAKLRMRIVEKLEQHGLKLDKIGLCFNKKISLEKLKSSQTLSRYKFYLALENSFHCRDYITEKFSKNSLGNFAVPVVWGPRKEDYEAYAPPNSFIHLDDFKSYKAFVEYIHYLDRNDTAYKEYFRWLNMTVQEMPNYGRIMNYCQLCRILNGINLDDVNKPDFDPGKLDRPLITREVARRQLPPIDKLFSQFEDPDCFKSRDEILKLNNTFAAKK